MPFETREDLEEIIELLNDGWERDDEIPYQPWGTEDKRIAQLVKYSDEEKAEIKAEEERRSIRPRPSVDLNLVTVPIISAKEDKAGKENLYKEYAALGYHEVHRTSQVAVMKLDDPRAVMLSDEEIETIIDGLGWIPNEDKGDDPEYVQKAEQLRDRLSEILKHSEAAKVPKTEDTQ